MSESDPVSTLFSIVRCSKGVQIIIPDLVEDLSITINPGE